MERPLFRYGSLPYSIEVSATGVFVKVDSRILFEILLETIYPQISRQDTAKMDVISSQIKLKVTLNVWQRVIAFRTLQHLFRGFKISDHNL